MFSYEYLQKVATKYKLFIKYVQGKKYFDEGESGTNTETIQCPPNFQVKSPFL